MAVGLLTAGCASNTITVRPPVQPAAVPGTVDATYRIEKATLGTSTALLPSEWDGKKFSARFARLAEERYPALFKNAPGSIPLYVRIEIDQETHDGPALFVFLGSLGIFGGVLPSLPWSTEWQVSVHAEDIRGACVRDDTLEADHRGWWSLFSPCGLVTIGGHSDIPKVSTVGTAGPGQIPPPFCTYVFQCAADRLAADLLKGNPAAWSAPSAAPLPADQSAPLPLPTQTAAPF